MPGPPGMAPIEIRNLSKAFGPVQAVRDLSFEVEAGRVTGFLGPNGAGKSTTLRMLLGLIRPTAGTATFDGQNYEQLPDPSAAVRQLLGRPGEVWGAESGADKLVVVRTDC